MSDPTPGTSKDAGKQGKKTAKKKESEAAATAPQSLVLSVRALKGVFTRTLAHAQNLIGFTDASPSAHGVASLEKCLDDTRKAHEKLVGAITHLIEVEADEDEYQKYELDLEEFDEEYSMITASILDCLSRTTLPPAAQITDRPGRKGTGSGGEVA